MKPAVRVAVVLVGAVLGVLVARVFLLNTIEQIALALLMDGALGARSIDPLSFLTSPVGLKLEIGALVGAGAAAIAGEKWIVPRVQAVAAAPTATDIETTNPPNRRPLIVALVVVLVIAAVVVGLALGGIRL